MFTKKYILLSIIFALASQFTVKAEDVNEFTHPGILSFEEPPTFIRTDKNSTFSLSTDHFKHLKKSLKWNWSIPGAQWSIRDSIPYRPNKTGSDSYVSTFVFWIYSTTPILGEKMRVEFLKDNKVQCFFEYGLEFQGWRGAWIAFDRDMQGKPVTGMDEVRFTAPNTAHGTLYIDHVILSSLQDIRQHTADFQAPYVNPKTTNHWLILEKSWEKDFDLPLDNNSSPTELLNLDKIQLRLTDLLMAGKKVTPLAELKNRVAEYNISLNPDGTLKGVPVFFERYGETYEMLGADRYNIVYDNLMGVKNVNDLLLDLAVSYNKTTNQADKDQYAALFILLTRHLMDQGFQAGSAMGTLHHAGYSMRDYYMAMFLMETPLQQNGLKAQVQQAMEWFAGTGEVKTKPEKKGIDVDAFNTYSIARMASILMKANGPQKVRYMKGFTRWIENGYAYVDGTEGTFKIDGTLFHHRNNYPAYAVGGLSGALEAVYLLHGTDFRISFEGHQHLKNALLAMRTYCNLLNWPLSLSGRHPDGKGKLNPEHFGLLALAGTPDGSKPVDKEMAEAYLRLIPKKTTRALNFEKEGFETEKSPNGNWTYNYSCLNVQRRKDWMVSAMGFSRYLWGSETYRGENMYGRYLNYGSIQILATGNPISNEGSGFRQEGWDWNHFPGTTATNLPIQDLRAKIRNLDEFSGFEEMLLSDEAFAGGISIQNKNGAFGMKLHEHDKYNGSFRVRKSVFFFDNRVVALGTNVQSALPEEVHTTLFQVYLDKQNKPYYLNGKEITDFPYKKSLSGENVLSDGQNNYFFVKQGNVDFTKMNQHSFHEETDKPTQNDFAKAVINHGGNPGNGKYEYMILVQPTADELKATLNSKSSIYKVLQQDSTAHIVCDNSTKTTGYVLFEAGKIKNNELLITETNQACLIMSEELARNKINLSVCDPDLHFYEGPSDEVYDKNGKRIERSVYSRKWIENESGKSTVQVTLRGKWKISVPNQYVKLISTNDTETIIAVQCQHGLSREIQLVK